MKSRKKKPGSVSISFMLTISIIVTIFLASSLSIFISYINAKKNAGRELQKELNNNIREITDILEMPLWAYDTETIEDIGKLYSRHETVVNLKIMDSLGKTLFEKHKISGGTILNSSKKVIHEGDTAGKVEISISSDKYEKSIKQLLLSGSFTIILNMVVLIALTGFFLRRFLSKPLQNLSSIVDSYSKGEYIHGDFKMPYREFIPVVDVIKDMGKRITNQIDHIKMANKRYRDIFENAVEGIFQINTDGSFIDINPAFARIFGFSTSYELIQSREFRTLLSDPKSISKVKEKLDKESIININEFEGLKKDGETVWLSVSVRSVKDSKGETLYYEGSLKDISDIREKEEAERKQKEADAENKAKSLFIANISHEIRTPLNSVLGMADLLNLTNCSEDQKEYIDILKSSGEFLRVIIDDILDFSKIEAGQLFLEEIPFQLGEIVDDVVNIVVPKDKDVVVKKHFEKEINRILLGDPVRIKQILINLMGNGVKFTKEGSVTIEVCPSEPEGNTMPIEFRVVDTGIGIEESNLETIFDSFSQAEKFTNRQFGGTGLGLAISKRLVGVMGGDLRVESEIGKGSVFYFSIPFKISDIDIDALSLETAEIESLPHLKILLADDIEPNRTVICKYLENYPVEITEVSDGLSAYNAFVKENFDLVLMDVEMPVMNGFDSTRKIREWEDENDKERTPLIVVSAHAFGEQKNECFEAGCDRLLIKPVNMKDLLQSIYEEACNKRVEISLPEGKSKENKEKTADDTVYIDRLFEDLMPDFFQYFEDTLKVMDKSLKKNDFVDLERLGHGLKGSSRNYELLELGEIFLDIENFAKEKDSESLNRKIVEAKEYMQNIKVEYIDRD